uniref:Transcription activator GCR1-like domain-containing protein n=1 Tax=Mycena chlorophos TaxID=658473 RepID=A0ABQ0KUC7_MYCCL|nr:predicted protein [Mycena chlorophos]
MGPPTPLAAKALKFLSRTTKFTALPLLPTPTFPDPPFCFDGMNRVVEYTPMPSSVVSESELPPSPILKSDGLKAAHDELEERSYRVRQTLSDEDDKQKETAATYRRHYKAYLAWFPADQALFAAANPNHAVLSALPITPAKVTVFLEHEMTRPQKRTNNGVESTSTCGVSHIKQVISALERYRFESQHLHKDIPDWDKPLRTDSRIKGIEKNAAHKEVERIQMAHTLKAAGTHADTFTILQHRQLSSSFFSHKGRHNIYLAMRDRCMHLTQASVAFRGDSSRSLLWSDLYHCEIPVPSKGLDAKIHALALLADQAKHNQTGRVDEHGAIRHRLVELCPINGFAFLFYAYFHIYDAPVPGFIPDFDDARYGDYGHREWYDLYTFSTSKDCKTEMSYANHRARVKRSFKANDIEITKVTHAGRGFTAKTAREHGASSEEVKALGGWNDSGSYRPCYDRALPLEALLGAAMFDSKSPQSHFIARETLEPPQSVVNAIFPWAESSLEELAERVASNSRARDIALHQFLHLLIWLRSVLVQDAALLYTMFPDSPIFGYPPFNSAEFRTFAALSVEHLEKAEREVALALQNLPQHLAHTFNASMSQVFLEQHRLRELLEGCLQQPALLSMPLNAIPAVAEVEPSRKRRKTGHIVSPPPLEAMTFSDRSYTPPFGPSAPDFPIASLSLPSGPDLAVPLGFGDPEMAVLDLFDPDQNFDIDLSSLDSSMFEGFPPLDTAGSDTEIRESHPVHLGFHASLPAPSPLLSGPALPSTPPIMVAPAVAVPVSVPTSTSTVALMPTSVEPTVADVQRREWERLAGKFTDARLRRMPNWEWITVGSRPTYLPFYDYQPVKKICDVWVEHTDGLNGLLSTRELDEEWGPSWRRNNASAKNENCRRKKVVRLVNQLAAKPNWSVQLALRFIREAYDNTQPRPFSTVRAFCDYLTKKVTIGGTGMDEVLLKANSYTFQH